MERELTMLSQLLESNCIRGPTRPGRRVETLNPSVVPIPSDPSHTNMIAGLGTR